MKYLTLLLTLIAYQASAGGYYCCKTGPQGPQGPQGEQGIPGKDGKDGAQGETGLAGSNGDVDYTGITQSAAISMIPSITHHSKNHSHTAIGFGIAGYEGEQSIAIGLQNQTDRWTFKGACAVAEDSKPMIGVGASWSF